MSIEISQTFPDNLIFVKNILRNFTTEGFEVLLWVCVGERDSKGDLDKIQAQKIVLKG